MTVCLIFDLKGKPGFVDATSFTNEDLKSVPISTVVLNLENARVDDIGIENTPPLPNLRCLDLDNTAVTDAGMISLLKFPMLEELWLEDTAISDAGFAQLNGLANLNFVSVSYTAISKEAMRKMERSIPSLIIHT